MDQLKSQIDEARKELRELKSGSLQKGEHLSGKKIWTSKDIQVMIYELAVYRTLFGKVNELCDSELMCNSSACLSRLHQTSELSAKVACL